MISAEKLREFLIYKNRESQKWNQKVDSFDVKYFVDQIKKSHLFNIYVEAKLWILLPSERDLRKIDCEPEDRCYRRYLPT